VRIISDDDLGGRLEITYGDQFTVVLADWINYRGNVLSERMQIMSEKEKKIAGSLE